jgi:hypothetical protein
LKEEAIDRTMWRNRFGRGVGPVVRQITEWMNEWMNAVWLLGILKCALSVASARNTLQRKRVKSNVLPVLHTASTLAIDKIYVNKKVRFLYFFN